MKKMKTFFAQRFSIRTWSLHIRDAGKVSVASWILRSGVDRQTPNRF